MNARQIYGRLNATLGWCASLANAGWRQRNVQNRPAVIFLFFRRLRGMSWFFYLTVFWLSWVAAMWMSRGWLGLFVSGQVLSAGTCRLKGPARWVQEASLRAIDPRKSSEGTHHEP
jgi:hypothetical protein